MGTRFNVLMTVQIPLEQKEEECEEDEEEGYYQEECEGEEEAYCFEECEEEDEDDAKSNYTGEECETPKKFKKCKGEPESEPRSGPQRGTASAARVSRGSQFDTWEGLSVQEPKRDAHQHVTVTVVIYNTVAGGVPGVEDVAAAVADMDALYASCGWTGALASEGANFMKSELTVSDVLKIAYKKAAQPYTPDSLAPENGDMFPTCTL